MKADTLIQFKRLAFRATIFIIIFFSIDKVLGEIVRIAYFSQENEYTYGILKTEADVIIVGSSRANSHYIPSIISDTLGMSCFNMGSGGQDIFFYYGIIGSILERYSPRIIIMDVTESDLEFREGYKDKLSVLLPFYRSSRSVREVINIRGAKERMKLLSGIYPFNSEGASILYSFLKKDNNPNLVMDGYIPLAGEISSPMFKVEREVKVDIDSIKIKFIMKIASLCQKNNIKLLMIVSPKYLEFSDKSSSFEFLNNLIVKYGIEVWDYEQDSYFLSHGSLFRDELHLNQKGAIEYSKIIAGRIKQTYKVGK